MKKTFSGAIAGILLSILASFSFAVGEVKIQDKNSTQDSPALDYSRPAEIINPFALGKGEEIPIMLAETTGSCGGTLTTAGGKICRCNSKKQRPVVNGENCTCEDANACK